MTDEEAKQRLGIDGEKLQELKDFMSEPVDFGFPDGYRPGEF